MYLFGGLLLCTGVIVFCISNLETIIINFFKLYVICKQWLTQSYIVQGYRYWNRYTIWRNGLQIPWWKRWKYGCVIICQEEDILTIQWNYHKESYRITLECRNTIPLYLVSNYMNQLNTQTITDYIQRTQTKLESTYYLSAEVNGTDITKIVNSYQPNFLHDYFEDDSNLTILKESQYYLLSNILSNEQWLGEQTVVLIDSQGDIQVI